MTPSTALTTTAATSATASAVSTPPTKSGMPGVSMSVMRALAAVGAGPGQVGERDAEGRLPRDLLGIVVADGRALLDGAPALDGAGAEQQCLREGRLARAGAAHEGDRPVRRTRGRIHAGLPRRCELPTIVPVHRASRQGMRRDARSAVARMPLDGDGRDSIPTMMEDLELWSEFNVAMVGATAALAGLVIVAASVNIGEIIKTRSLTARLAAGDRRARARDHRLRARADPRYRAGVVRRRC